MLSQDALIHSFSLVATCKMTSDCETKMNINQEKPTIKESIPKFARPINLTYSMAIPSFRLTYSDVMCTTITTKRTNWKSNETKYKKHQCNYPYAEAYSGMKNLSLQSKHTTLLEQKRIEAVKIKRNKELHAEHREFMENLKKERESRAKEENTAAIVIQRYMRGFTARENLGLLPNLQRKPFKYSDQEITNFLIEQAKILGFKSKDENVLLSYKDLPFLSC